MTPTQPPGPPGVALDLISTLALAAVSLGVGRAVRDRVGWLARSNIPAPAVGGLGFALVAAGLRAGWGVAVQPDVSLRAPLQIAFFTTVGLGATAALFRAGGRRLLLFWGIVSLTGVVQNAVGIAMARVLGVPDAVGIICGAVTLTGGPATGLSFTETFEKLGIPGAGPLILASATFGIVLASLVGNPVASALIRLRHLAPEPSPDLNPDPGGPAPPPADRDGHAATGRVLLHNLLALLIVMGVGSVLGAGLGRLGLIVPAFLGPMIVAAAARNLDDRTGWFRFDPAAIEILGLISLSLFFVVALMDLKLGQIAGLAGPMVAILLVQVVVTVAFAVATTFCLLGRDYEAAVTTSGHIGFGLGITPNAVSNMDALVARHGPAPRSFLIVPVVGAFLIDLSNPLVITAFVNLVRPSP